MSADFQDRTGYGVRVWTPCGIRMLPEPDSAHPN